MPKKLRVLIAGFVWMGLSVTISQAEPLNHPYHLMSVSQAIAMGHSDQEGNQYVMLVGHVLGRIGDDTYNFTDGTGVVKLACGDFKLPPGQVLVIGGRINHPFLGIGSMVVDVIRWHPMNGAGPASLTP